MMENYRIPQLSEFKEGFEFEKLTKFRSLNDDSFLATEVVREEWVECTVIDLSGFGDAGMKLIEMLYERDPSRFRVKVV